jgi:hypothetical protein
MSNLLATRYTLFLSSKIILMTKPFCYSTNYILDKSHYIETYEASAPTEKVKKLYLIAIIFALLGLTILLFSDINPYAAWFLIALGALEVFSIRFRQSWWLARQLTSKAANSELTLKIDDFGVSTKSIHVESIITWQDVYKVEQTKQGWLLYHAGGKNYISARSLSVAANEFISAKASQPSQ